MQGRGSEEMRKKAVLAGFTRCDKNKRWQDILCVSRQLDKRLIVNSSGIFHSIHIAEAKMTRGQ